MREPRQVLLDNLYRDIKTATLHFLRVTSDLREWEICVDLTDYSIDVRHSTYPHAGWTSTGITGPEDLLWQLDLERDDDGNLVDDNTGAEVSQSETEERMVEFCEAMGCYSEWAEQVLDKIEDEELWARQEAQEDQDEDQ